MTTPQGRFISRDTWVGEQTEPLTQNKYIYVTNNPVNYLDPTGEKRSTSRSSSGKSKSLSKARSIKSSVSKITKSVRSSLSSKIRSAARLSISIKTSVKDKLSNTVRKVREAGRIADNFARKGGLKSKIDSYTKGTKILRNISSELKKNTKQMGINNRFSGASKLIHAAGAKLANWRNVKNIGFGSNISSPTAGSRFDNSGKKGTYGKARVQLKKSSNLIKEKGKTGISNAVFNASKTAGNWTNKNISQPLINAFMKNHPGSNAPMKDQVKWALGATAKVGTAAHAPAAVAAAPQVAIWATATQLPRIANLAPRLTQPVLRGAGKGPVIIGETMKRVEMEVAKHPDAKILNDMPAYWNMGLKGYQVTSKMMEYNRKWILDQLRSGRQIIDIGKDPNRKIPSIFYQMEQNMIKNYQKLHPEWNQHTVK